MEELVEETPGAVREVEAVVNILVSGVESEGIELVVISDPTKVFDSFTFEVVLVVLIDSNAVVDLEEDVASVVMESSVDVLIVRISGVMVLPLLDVLEAGVLGTLDNDVVEVLEEVEVHVLEVLEPLDFSLLEALASLVALNVAEMFKTSGAVEIIVTGTPRVVDVSGVPKVELELKRKRVDVVKTLLASEVEETVSTCVVGESVQSFDAVCMGDNAMMLAVIDVLRLVEDTA